MVDTKLPMLMMVCTLLLLAQATLAAGLQDPTQPHWQAATTAADSSALTAPVLEGVLIAPDRRLALIQGKAYQVGQQLRGFRILRIEADKIVVQNAQGSQIWRVPGLPVRPAADTDKSNDKAPTP